MMVYVVTLTDPNLPEAFYCAVVAESFEHATAMLQEFCQEKGCAVAKMELLPMKVVLMP